MKSCRFAILLFLAVMQLSRGENPPATSKSGSDRLKDYFRAETAALATNGLSDIKTLSDWKAKKIQYRQEFLDMLGLWPLPQKTDLQPVITGKIEHEEFTVEKLHFQSLPRLYVTANLYLPKNVKSPCPTILYVCGHAKVVTNGISFGNKTAYQHHGAWFARNGYACLLIDTLQLGEIEGTHHGTHREGMWWWNSRGYTPAGVEAWNSLRALDYLETRPEVDKTRFGVTGRSGGGAYSWTLAAIDDRVKVAAPVAGITDLQNYVVDDCVEGHCDCMFHVNTHRWDFPQFAALLAPRPLMIANSDKDKIFPLDGVVRLHSEVKRIYELHKASTNLALLITDGPHSDTQDLQLPVFRWFNRHLKKEDPVIEMAARKFFAPEQLKVFAILPTDQINTRIHETFVPTAASPMVPQNSQEWLRLRESWKKGLSEKVFRGWPKNVPKNKLQTIATAAKSGLHFTEYELTSQENVVLPLWKISTSQKSSKPATLHLLDEKTWPEWSGAFARRDAAFFQDKLPPSKGALFLFAPRGIGSSAWEGDAKKQIHIRRRFMLLGQTLDGMRVWDIRRAVQAIEGLRGKKPNLNLEARETMAVNALYASLFEDAVTELRLAGMPAQQRNSPDYLNVLRLLDLPQALAMALEKRTIFLTEASASDWAFPLNVARQLGWPNRLEMEAK